MTLRAVRQVIRPAVIVLAGAMTAPLAAREWPSVRLSTAGLPTTIIDLQPFRTVQSGRAFSGEGRQGTTTLVNLNPAINAWYVLTVTWQGGAGSRDYHLENPRPLA